MRENKRFFHIKVHSHYILILNRQFTQHLRTTVYVWIIYTLASPQPIKSKRDDSIHQLSLTYYFSTNQIARLRSVLTRPCTIQTAPTTGPESRFNLHCEHGTERGTFKQGSIKNHFWYLYTHTEIMSFLSISRLAPRLLSSKVGKFYFLYSDSRDEQFAG